MILMYGQLGKSSPTAPPWYPVSLNIGCWQVTSGLEKHPSLWLYIFFNSLLSYFLGDTCIDLPQSLDDLLATLPQTHHDKPLSSDDSLGNTLHNLPFDLSPWSPLKCPSPGMALLSGTSPLISLILHPSGHPSLRVREERNCMSEASSGCTTKGWSSRQAVGDFPTTACFIL